MDLMNAWKVTTVYEVPDDHFVVIHPLDDRREEKVDISSVGLMPMTTSVRLSLIALRAYLILMMVLVLYHIVDLAGAFGK